MLGVCAQAASEHITVDSKELSDAGWFDRATVKAALARSSSKESPVLQAHDGGSGVCMHAATAVYTYFYSTAKRVFLYYFVVAVVAFVKNFMQNTVIVLARINCDFVSSQCLAPLVLASV
jgi:hypothetical protein